MVFGCQHNIARASLLEEVGPLVGIKMFRAELRGEVGIGDPVAVYAGVKISEVYVVLPKPLVVPFRIFRVDTLHVRGRIGGDRVNAPVNHDAEFGVPPPLRGRTLVQ